MKIEEEIKQSKFKNEYQKAMINIMYTCSWLNLKHTTLLKPFDISPQQFNVLRILRGQHPGSATVNLLIERMIDKNSNASRLVEKLRLKGLVDRQVNESDRRAVNVKITSKGLKLLQELDKEEETWPGLFKSLSETEAKQLNKLLDKLRSTNN